jgi:hypothetical protein
VDKEQVIEYLTANLSSEEYRQASIKDQARILYDLIGDCGFIDTSTENDVDVEDIVENEDGSADLTIRMSHDTLVFYAQIGLLKTLKDAAERTLSEQDL